MEIYIYICIYPSKTTYTLIQQTAKKPTKQTNKQTHKQKWLLTQVGDPLRGAAAEEATGATRDANRYDIRYYTIQ